MSHFFILAQNEPSFGQEEENPASQKIPPQKQQSL